MEGLDIPSFVFGSTSLRPPKVSSKDEIYSARWKLRLISDQAKGGGSMSPFHRWFTSRILNKSTVCVEKRFNVTIFVEKARVLRSDVKMFSP